MLDTVEKVLEFTSGENILTNDNSIFRCVVAQNDNEDCNYAGNAQVGRMKRVRRRREIKLRRRRKGKTIKRFAQLGRFKTNGSMESKLPALMEECIGYLGVTSMSHFLSVDRLPGVPPLPKLHIIFFKIMLPYVKL